MLKTESILVSEITQVMRTFLSQVRFLSDPVLFSLQTLYSSIRNEKLQWTM